MASSGVAQKASSRNNKTDDIYTGKRFNSYGKALEKQNKPNKKVNKDDVFYGDAKKKAYPIGMQKDRTKKRKSNFKGKKRKKDCNCPGH